MPTPTEIFNKTLDRNTLERLQAEDAAALQIFRILDGTRAELYAKLRAFEDRIGEGAEARYSAIVLAQTIHEVNLTFAKMDATISPAFRAQLQAGYTQAQRQTYAEVAAFERATPGFPEVFKPVAPTDAVLQFMDGQNATMTRLNDGLRARVVQELQRVQPNISDAEALAAAGADATRIKEAISRGIVSGDGTLSIARRLAAPIDGEFPRLANNTVMRTVRLGINESFNHGHEERIRESAKVVPGLGKAWVSALRRSTKICLDLHGQKCGVGESFRIQGQDVARPPAIGAGLRPAFHLCRSRVVPWNPKWPPNPKLDELTTEEKEHFLNGGGKTDKQKGQGPKAIDGAKAALDERAKQLREKLDADKAAQAAAKIAADIQAKRREERALFARQKLVAQERQRLKAKAALEAAQSNEAAEKVAQEKAEARAKAAAEARAKADAALRKELTALKAARSGFQEMKSQADIDGWAAKAYDLDSAPLIVSERAAVLAWQTPATYREIQAGLRGANNLGISDASGKVYTPEQLLKRNAQTIEDLDALLEFHTSKEAFKTFRGFHGDAPIEALKAAVGGYHTELGYTATSPLSTVADRFSRPTVNLKAPRAIMELRVPKGTPNFYCNLVQDIGEAEILLGRGTEYRVISHELRDGVNHFVVDVLTPAESKARKAAEEAAKKAALPGPKEVPSVLKIGSGNPRDGLTPAEVAVYDSILGDKATTDGLKNILTPTGTELRSFNVRVWGGNVRIDAAIYKDGEYAASIERTFRADGGVHHDSFFVKEEFQGLGWSKEVYAKQFAAYRELGVKLVDIDANGSVGKYSWALQGFDFADTSELENARRRLRDLVDSKGYLTAAESKKINGLKHSWQIATYRLEVDGQAITEMPTELMLFDKIKNVPMHLGKWAMLRQTSWDGVISMDKTSPSWKQFELYNGIAEKKKRGRPPGSKNKPKAAHKYGLSRPESDFRNFNNDKKACDVWGLKRYTVAGYTSRQVDALKFYQGSGYRQMNAGLRGLDLYGEKAETLLRNNADAIKALDSVMNEKPLDAPQYVVRGTDFEPLKAQVLANIGGEFYDPAYMSTAVVKEVSEGGFAHVYPDYNDPKADYRTNPGSLMWRMYMPEGTPAFYLNAVEDIGEAEILIGRGMRYRILSHEVIQGVDWVTVEGLPYEQPK